MTTIEKAQSASVFFFFFYPRHVYRSLIDTRANNFHLRSSPSLFHLHSIVLVAFFALLIAIVIVISIRLFLGREAKKWRENGEIPSKVFERNFLSRRWKGRREMTQHTTMQATRETVSAAKLDSRWTAAWSNIVQWLSNELMHSPVHVPIIYDTIG